MRISINLCLYKERKDSPRMPEGFVVRSTWSLRSQNSLVRYEDFFSSRIVSRPEKKCRDLQKITMKSGKRKKGVAKSQKIISLPNRLQNIGKKKYSLCLVYSTEIFLLTYFVTIQVNLCQKLLFLHQLTLNMMADCSLFMKIVSWEVRIPAEHVVFINCFFFVLFWHSEQFWYTTCSTDVASFWKIFTCTFWDFVTVSMQIKWCQVVKKKCQFDMFYQLQY